MTSFEAEDLAQFLKEQRARYDRTRMEVRSKRAVLRALMLEFQQKARIDEAMQVEEEKRQSDIERRSVELKQLEEKVTELKLRRKSLAYLLERTARDNSVVFRELHDEQRQLKVLRKKMQKVRVVHAKTMHNLEQIRKEHRKMHQRHRKQERERQERRVKAQKRLKGARRTRRRRRRREERRAKIAAEVAGDLSAEEEKAMKKDLVAKQFQANQLEAKLKRSAKRSAELRAGQ